METISTPFGLRPRIVSPRKVSTNQVAPWYITLECSRRSSILLRDDWSSSKQGVRLFIRDVHHNFMTRPTPCSTDCLFPDHHHYRPLPSNHKNACSFKAYFRSLPPFFCSKSTSSSCPPSTYPPRRCKKVNVSIFLLVTIVTTIIIIGHHHY